MDTKPNHEDSSLEAKEASSLEAKSSAE